VRAANPVELASLVEAEMKKVSGAWKIDFGYLRPGLPRAYFTVTFGADLRVEQVSPIWSGRD
jgi:hypothetical protein